jgi:hypothetical protein
MLQPRDLACMVRVDQLCRPLRAIWLRHLQKQIHTRLQLISADDVQPVINTKIIVSCGIGERKRKHSLLLEVGLVDARKAAGYHGHSSEISRLQCSVLAAGALAVVPVADDAPSNACVAVALCDSGHHIYDLRGEVESLSAKLLRADAGLCAGEKVVGDVLQVAAVFVPWAGGGDMVGGTFALGRVSAILSTKNTERMSHAHSPWTLIKTDRSRALPSTQGLKGVRSWRFSLSGPT